MFKLKHTLLDAFESVQTPLKTVSVHRPRLYAFFLLQLMKTKDHSIPNLQSPPKPPYLLANSKPVKLHRNLSQADPISQHLLLTVLSAKTAESSWQ
jgi:hypothetical protein